MLENDILQCVIFRVEKQLFAISVKRVQDILMRQKVTNIPLAPTKVMGSLNLRGRIVTAMDTRCLLSMGKTEQPNEKTSIVVEIDDFLYSLLVDKVYVVKNVSISEISPIPGNMSESWQNIGAGVLQYGEEMVLLIDVDKLLCEYKNQAAC
jgi:purine-binding chemotaxis protein CheW